MRDKKLTWIDWTYYSAVLALSGYTVYLLYSVNSGGNTKLMALRAVSAVCKGAATAVGKAGMAAESAYMRIIESERMI